MLLNNCKINLILIWSANCVVINYIGGGIFEITDAKLYVPVVALSIQDNAKLLHLKSGFKRTSNWNKYQWKVTIERQNQYLDYLIDPNFQGINILFVLLFEGNTIRTGHTGYFLPKVGIKDFMFDGKMFLIN